MKISTSGCPAWSTTAYGDPAETTPKELSALGEHFNLCKDKHWRLNALHDAAASMHGFMAARFVTTLVFISLLATAVLLVL